MTSNHKRYTSFSCFTLWRCTGEKKKTRKERHRKHSVTEIISSYHNPVQIVCVVVVVVFRVSRACCDWWVLEQTGSRVVLPWRSLTNIEYCYCRYWENSAERVWLFSYYIHTYIHTYRHTYVRTYVHTYIRQTLDRQRQTNRQTDRHWSDRDRLRRDWDWSVAPNWAVSSSFAGDLSALKRSNF